MGKGNLGGRQEESANRKMVKAAVVETEVAETGSDARLLELRSVLENGGGSAAEVLARVREMVGVRSTPLLEDSKGMGN